MWIEIAVPKIVDCTARSAHYQGTTKEAKGCSQDRERRRSCIISSQERREEAREEKIVGSSWLVEAHQLGIRDPWVREVRDEARVRGLVC